MTRAFVSNVVLPLTGGKLTMIHCKKKLLVLSVILFYFLYCNVRLFAVYRFILSLHSSHEHSRRRPNCPWVARHEFIHPASFEFILAGKSDDLAVKDISHVPKIKIVQTPRRTPSKTRDISQTPSRKTSNIDISRTPSRKTIKISSVIPATPQSKIPILSELRSLFPHTKQEEVLNWTMQDLIDRLIREKVDKFDQFLKGQ